MDKRILLAEDNFANQKIALLFLSRIGLDADVAANGTEAVAAAAKNKYDLIFMDCEMPEMDGYAAAREIRRLEGNSRRTPIVAMTAHTSEADAQKCLAAGMDGSLSKPISVEKISAALAAHTAVDASRLLELRNQDEGGAQLMQEVIAQYLQDAPAYITAIRQGVLGGDAEKVRRAAHALNGSSSNFNAGRLCALSAQMEREAEKGWLTQAGALVDILQHEFQDVRTALENANRKAA